MLPKRLKILASLRLAVFVILALAVISAVGTIYESLYDMEIAHRLVYHSWYMYGILGLLCINLTAVMVDRWPWKRRHIGFVMAHVGIILTLFGAWITQEFGVDGTMAFSPGQSSRYVTLSDKDLIVYASLGTGDVRPVYHKNVDFVTHPPQTDPVTVKIGDDTIKVVEYQHFAYRNEEMLPSDRPVDGPAVRFQLVNSNFNMTKWLRREASRSYRTLDLGPAEVVLSDGSYKPQIGKNEVVLSPSRRPETLHYAVYDRKNLLKKRGEVNQSGMFDVGWMGIKLRILRYLPRAHEQVTYTKGSPSPMAEPAIKIRFQGADYWMGNNSILRLYSNDRMYIVSYGQRRLQLKFALKLEKFNIGHYQGTNRPASYESLVEVPGRGDVRIYMNHPLKYEGFTFYQSSFEQDKNGQPSTSVLSVNYDPGRWIKYIGSLMIVLGSIILFYFKKLQRKKARAK